MAKENEKLPKFEVLGTEVKKSAKLDNVTVEFTTNDQDPNVNGVLLTDKGNIGSFNFNGANKSIHLYGIEGVLSTADLDSCLNLVSSIYKIVKL